MHRPRKLLLLQKSGGFKVAKASLPVAIDPGITYNVQVTYDGVNFHVSLDGSVILTEAAGTVPSGNAGFRVKQVEGIPVTGFFEDILVQ